MTPPASPKRASHAFAGGRRGILLAKLISTTPRNKYLELGRTMCLMFLDLVFIVCMSFVVVCLAWANTVFAKARAYSYCVLVLVYA